ASVCRTRPPTIARGRELVGPPPEMLTANGFFKDVNAARPSDPSSTAPICRRGAHRAHRGGRGARGRKDGRQAAGERPGASEGEREHAGEDRRGRGAKDAAGAHPRGVTPRLPEA